MLVKGATGKTDGCALAAKDTHKPPSIHNNAVNLGIYTKLKGFSSSKRKFDTIHI